MTIDRRRGALFEASAFDYDLYRPSYPIEVICQVVSLSNLRSSSRLLEIGCGTGKATVHFAARGFMVDCIEPGKRLIDFARRNCRGWQNASFTRGTFEDVHLEPRSYDLVYSAQAFHWVDPGVRLLKAANALVENGSLALLYNYPGKTKDRFVPLLNDAIEEASGGILKGWHYGDEIADWTREIGSSGLFRGIGLFRHQWMQSYSAERYTGLFRTYSDFLSLPRPAQRKVLHRIRSVIEDNGGCVCRSYDCVLIHAQKG